MPGETVCRSEDDVCFIPQGPEVLSCYVNGVDNFGAAQSQGETEEQEACRQINAEYDVEGLCMELLGKLRKLREAEGDRLRK